MGLEAERRGQVLALEAVPPGHVERPLGPGVLHRQPVVAATPPEPDPDRAVPDPAEQDRSLGRHDEGQRGPEAPELPVGGRGPREAEHVLLDRCGQLVEQAPDPPAVEGAEVAGQAGGGDRLGLGQVVALGLLGQPGLDHVEGGQVRSVVLGPVHPDPDQRARGQVHAGGVLGDGRPAPAWSGRCRRPPRSAAAVLDGAGHVPGRPVPRACGSIEPLLTRSPDRSLGQLGGQGGGVVGRQPAGVVAGRRRRSPGSRPSHSGEPVGSPQARTASGSQRPRTASSRSGRSPVIDHLGRSRPSAARR